MNKPNETEGRQDDNSGLWGEPIHTYTRAQAIADGILVDLTTATDDQGQRLCQQAGFKIPVAMTQTTWAKTVEAGGTWKPTDDGGTLELKGGQSLTGRLSWCAPLVAYNRALGPAVTAATTYNTESRSGESNRQKRRCP